MKEHEIRPQGLLDEYLRLCADDASRLNNERERFVQRQCPACGHEKADKAFVKLSFEYRWCCVCGSLFAGEIPSAEQLDAFYQDSKSADFWANDFFPSVAEARRSAIIRPRANKVIDLARSFDIDLQCAIDVGAGSGLFLEELAGLSPEAVVKAVEPGRQAANKCRNLGLETFEGFASEASLDPAWANSADLVTCFEVIEHVADPLDFISGLASLARPGGYVLFSGLCGDGFDILVLGENSNAVFPPHHINFISQQGFGLLLSRCGLTEVSTTTPGQLDVDIVSNALKARPDLPLGAFERWLVSQASEAQRASFQSFLVENKLSSHAWILAQRPVS